VRPVVAAVVGVDCAEARGEPGGGGVDLVEAPGAGVAGFLVLLDEGVGGGVEF